MSVPKRKTFVVKGTVTGQPRGELIIATDAAVNPTRVGVAWIASSGHWGAAGYPHRQMVAGANTSLIAELRAVAYGWRHVNPDGPVTVLSDSADALRLLARWQAGDIVMPPSYDGAFRSRGKRATLLTLADKLNGRPEVTFRQVRGHTGHPLNEAADSLAKLAMRGRLDRAEADAAGRVIARNRLLDFFAAAVPS